ncbi:hypothetical protein BKA69DRAFT_1101492 [Paraphysoderma sedebokerense]|nr:hypothetical protein BKA69DRAFT_1101492 [Paraphysoderma sedebokerense]
MEAGDLSNRIRQNRQLRELQTKPIQPLPNVQLPSIPQNPIIQPLPNLKVPSVRPFPNTPQLPDINVPRIQPFPNRAVLPTQIATPIPPNLLVSFQPSSSNIVPVSTTTIQPAEGISGLNPQPPEEVHHGQNSSNESMPTSQPIPEDSKASTDPYVIVGIIVGVLCVTLIGFIYLRKRKLMFSTKISAFSSSSTKVNPISKSHSSARSTDTDLNVRDPSFTHSLSSFGKTESSYSIGLRHDAAYSYCRSSGVPNSWTDRSSESRPYSDSTWGSSEDGGSDLDGSSKRQEVIIYMQYPETAVLKR